MKTLKKLAYSVMYCVCLFKGHEPEKHLTETEGYIATTRCKKCRRTLMGGFTWKIKHIPPPNSTPKQIEEWKAYCESEWQIKQGNTNLKINQK